MDTDLEQGLIEIGKSRLDFNGIQVDMQGRVQGLNAEPQIDLDLELPGLELRAALAALPPGLVTDLKSYDPAGLITGKLKLAGGFEDSLALLRGGQLQLKKVEATVADMRPALTGPLTLSRASLGSKALELQIGDNRADVSFSVNNLYGKPIVGVSHIVADRFQLDPLLKSAAAPGVVGEEKPDPAAKKAKEIGPFDLPLQWDGTIRVAEALYRGLNIKDFRASYALKDNVLTVSELTGKVAGGQFTSTARANLGKPGLQYETSLKLQQVQAEPFIQAFAPQLSGLLFGGMDLAMDMKGAGTQWETISRTLTGQGDLLVNKGHFAGQGLVLELAEFLKINELKEIDFDQLKGHFRINEGKVQVDGSMTGKEVRLAPRGTVGLDGSLNLDLDTRLSPTLSEKFAGGRGNLGQFLKDDEGWVRLPLKLTGAMANPIFSADSEMIGGAVKKQLQKEIEKQLFGKEEAGLEEDPRKKQLKETLRGIFGN